MCALRCFDGFSMCLVYVLVIMLFDLLFAVYHRLSRFCIIFVAMLGSCIFLCSCSMLSSFLSLMFRIIRHVVLRTASSLDQSFFLRTMESRLYVRCGITSVLINFVFVDKLSFVGF